jgi:replicative DNA helicase
MIMSRKRESTPVGRDEITVYVDVENEQLILAAMMDDSAILTGLARSLNRDLFIGERHKVIFDILQDIAKRRLLFDVDTFEQLGRKRDYGTRKYISSLVESFDKPKNLDFHLERLRVDSIKYTLRVGPLQGLVDLASDPTTTLDEISSVVRSVQSGLTGKLGSGAKSGKTVYLDYLADMRARREASLFIPTGLDWLDESLTEGLARGKISVWTARPSMGKSTVAWNIANNLANTFKIKVGYFPIEMGMISTLDGIVSSQTGISLDQLIKTPQDLTRSELTRINDKIYQITSNNLLVFWTQKILFDKLENIIMENGFDVVIFDLWERMMPKKEPSVIDFHLGKFQEMMQETECHGMVLHQTKRGVEKRPDKRPTLEDLKNSGAYEEYADLVIGIYRDQYYDESLPDNVVELEILKQRRGGRLKTHYYRFDGPFGRIGEEMRHWGGSDDYS